MFIRYLLVKILNVCYRGSVGGLLKCHLVHSTSIMVKCKQKALLHSTLIRGDYNIKERAGNDGEDVDKLLLSYVASGNTYIIATLGSSLAIPQKVNV